MWGQAMPTRVLKKPIKRSVNPTMPTEPGRYYWSEWDAVVTVYRKHRGRQLHVTPPGGIEIMVTPNIAGKFKRVEEPA